MKATKKSEIDKLLANRKLRGQRLVAIECEAQGVTVRRSKARGMLIDLLAGKHVRIDPRADTEAGAMGILESFYDVAQRFFGLTLHTDEMDGQYDMVFSESGVDDYFCDRHDRVKSIDDDYCALLRALRDRDHSFLVRAFERRGWASVGRWDPLYAHRGEVLECITPENAGAFANAAVDDSVILGWIQACSMRAVIDLAPACVPAPRRSVSVAL